MSPNESSSAVDEPALALGELDGSTFYWWGYVVSLGLFRLIARSPMAKYAEVLFWDVRYVDLPVTLRSARVRQATRADLENARQSVPRKIGLRLTEATLFVLESDAGRFFIRGRGARTRWLSDHEAMFATAAELPLWDGGPAPRDL